VLRKFISLNIDITQSAKSKSVKLHLENSNNIMKNWYEALNPYLIDTKKMNHFYSIIISTWLLYLVSSFAIYLNGRLRSFLCVLVMGS